MKTFKTKVTAEFNPDSHDIAEAFWSMDSEEQCYFFAHLYEISKGALPMQLQYLTEDEAFNIYVKLCMQLIGEYGNAK